MIFFTTHQRQEVCAWSSSERHRVLLVDQQVLLAALHLGGEVKVKDANANVTTGGEVEVKDNANVTTGGRGQRKGNANVTTGIEAVVEVNWRIDMRATGSKHVILLLSIQML